MTASDIRTLLEQALPRLIGTDYRVTSSASPAYNCIAWAAGVSDRWWWPKHDEQAFWPSTVIREVTVPCFVEAFATVGYSVAEDSSSAAGFERIALYTLDGVPTHAARQLPSGRWTSKLGVFVDIEHGRPEDVAGGMYGNVELILHRAHV